MSTSGTQIRQVNELLVKRWSTAKIAGTVGVSPHVVAGLRAARTIDYNNRFALARATERLAVTMAKVGVRRLGSRAAWPRWQFSLFYGPKGRESRGVVDLMAVRKNYKDKPRAGLKLGDALEIVLFQVKGGSAAKPTKEDGKRLRRVMHLHRASHVVLATWTRGQGANFYCLRPARTTAKDWKRDWDDDVDFTNIFD